MKKNWFVVAFLSLFLPTCSFAKTNVAIQWNFVALEGIRDAKLGAPMSSRALAIMDSCVYDAWTAYDERAVGTQLSGALRRPASERTEANKEEAISYAVYRALTGLLPAETICGNRYSDCPKRMDTQLYIAERRRLSV